MFASNVRAPLFLVGALAPGLVDRGLGSIISLSSMAGGVGLAGGAAYGATKASLEAMTRAWPAEYSASGVHVSAVAPGPVYTPTPWGAVFITALGGDDADAPRIPRSSRSSRPPASYITGATIAGDVERSR